MRSVLPPVFLSLCLFLAAAPAAWADEADSMSMKVHDATTTNSDDLSDMETLDVAMNMPMPLAMEHMPMTMLMLHGNVFLSGVAEEGVPRGRGAVFSTNMFMADLGTTLDDTQYLNLDVMATAELWTVPSNGYPELLQIGENQSSGQPFLDAQHPHSSPLMGLTLSDTIRLADDKSNLKLFVAPRGESTDGPIAFMHRVTGMVDPNAPLGHHVGQDVGHISSSVLGASLKLGGFHIEASTFNGTEPEPTQVDLPLGTLNSFAFRAIEEFSPELMMMASYAYVAGPEPTDPTILSVGRYSASVYLNLPLDNHWWFHDSLIYGLITNLDHSPQLSSVCEEFLFNTDDLKLYGRVEALQRTPNELQIGGLPNPDQGRWVSAITLGLSHSLVKWDGWDLSFGAQVTNDQLPPEYQTAYAGNPFTYQFYFQWGGMQMDRL
jgi:hypothetical protein